MPPRKIAEPLLYNYDTNYKYEICLDEAGRGPLLGRLYVCGVVLPLLDTNNCFDYSHIKDSKKFTNKNKRIEVGENIKKHCKYCIDYIESQTIDEINILQSVYKGMHNCVNELLLQIKRDDPTVHYDQILIIVDGDRFKPFQYFDNDANELYNIAHVCVEKGDAKYVGVAAASICAKNAHDEYIVKLVEQYPEYEDKYGLLSNMGYGTSKHIEGIKTHGITIDHRKSFVKKYC